MQTNKLHNKVVKLQEQQETLAERAQSLEKLNEISPRYIFFPHWSYIIPKEIFDSFDCIIFHINFSGDE